MEIEGDHELSSGRKAKAARTEKLPPAVEGKAEGRRVKPVGLGQGQGAVCSRARS